MIHIIIPVHNRIQETIKCLYALDKQTYKEFKVYVVDDGSIDGTPQVLANDFPHVKIIQGSGELWWTGAIRKAVEFITIRCSVGDGEYLMTLNNDVFLAEDALSLLMDFSNKHPRSLVNALSVSGHDGDTIITSGNKMVSWILNISYHPYHGCSYKKIKKLPCEVDMLTGRSVLYPAMVFKEVGNFNDKDFPHYGGDNEFTWRAKRMGWKLFIVPTALAFVNQGTTGLNPGAIKMNFKQMITSMFSASSGINIGLTYRFAVQCCPWYAIPTYLMMRYIKIFAHFIVGNHMAKRMSK